jgi:AraC family transcriptional regulator of arabinose operon
MNEIQRAAELHWRLLNRLSISRDEYCFCLDTVFGRHRGSLAHRLSRHVPETVTNSIFQRQPGTAQLIAEWTPLFACPGAVSVTDAARFVLAVYNGAEELSELFTSSIMPGTARHLRGTLSDYITRWPTTKLGWMVQLTVGGHGHYNCVRTQFQSGPGDLILFSPDALYDFRRAVDSESWEHQWIYFPQQSRWLDLLQWPEIGPGIHRTRVEGAEFERLRVLFTEVGDIHLAELPLAQALIENLLEQILIRCRQLLPHSGAPAVDKRVRKTMDLIARRFAEGFAVEDLAGYVGLSAPRLARLFRQQTGLTIKQWRDERRMARATQLLIQTRLPLSRIAQDVGYEDPLYFSRCFSAHFGCSPRQWRETRWSESLFNGEAKPQ